MRTLLSTGATGGLPASVIADSTGSELPVAPFRLGLTEHQMETFDDIQTAADAFALTGEDMRIHKGRSVVTLTLNGKAHYLKRFWFLPSQAFKRHVARGFHELRMIDWLNHNGFAGPNVVRRGHSGLGPFRTRIYFLMEEVPGELPLEATWRKSRAEADELLRHLAGFAARLHDAGFVHTDFSERHILVGRSGNGCENDGWAFRLIDVERACVGQATDKRAAADLATLAASVADERLRERIRSDFIEEYVRQRKTLAPGADFCTLFANATPAGSFS